MWKREGECNKCGICCYLGLGMTYKTTERGKKDITEMRPFATVKGNRPHICKAFDTKTFLCKKHKKKKGFYNDFCKPFPSNPKELRELNKILRKLGFPPCSYKFVRVKKDG